MSNWMRLPILAAGMAISLDGSQRPSPTIEEATYGDAPVKGDPFIDEGGEG
jgi:hypothetical protein